MHFDFFGFGPHFIWKAIYCGKEKGNPILSCMSCLAQPYSIYRITDIKRFVLRR